MATLPSDDSRRQIRLFRDADEAEVVQFWRRAGQAAYPYLPIWQAFTLETARRIFHEVVRACCTIWVGIDGKPIVAFLATKGAPMAKLVLDLHAIDGTTLSQSSAYSRAVPPGRKR
jgi:hypothetical protein